ncbi:V-set and immunoglobulin domain-containing protein 8b [Chanos chanos]|uniref:V-set and immunoglobulin domain-containing protein 8b n=1 Tax=Chanos chanos TaxID=29144 RepID=UPI0011F1D1E0|nr:coxsackievirus and adenovirus receptor homolog [Chanos chanos]
MATAWNQIASLCKLPAPLEGRCLYLGVPAFAPAIPQAEMRGQPSPQTVYLCQHPLDIQAFLLDDTHFFSSSLPPPPFCLWLHFPYVIAVCLNNAAITLAIRVTSTGPQTIKKAVGQDVILGCTYSESPDDAGELDIEWTIVSQDMTQKDQLILSYTGGREFKLGDPSLMSRLSFTADPSRGDATIAITSLRVTDTATYQCKVKKTPGIDSRKVTLVVLVRPSVPKCWVEGREEKGAAFSLCCKSSKGSTPLTYTWKRESGGPMPPTASQNSQTGELLIRNHSESYTGHYLCEVSNEVGKEQCKYTLKAHNPTNKAGVIAGAVIGALLLLLLLLLLIWLLICCCHKRRYEKEVANEIREDAPAPESRPNSRLSSIRTVMGYRAHSGVAYSAVRQGQTARSPSGRSSIYTDPNGVPRPSSNTPSDYKPPLRYDSKYGYPV